MIGIWLFEIFVVLFAVGLWFYLKKTGTKHALQRMLILFIGVFVFEVMSEPMWKNYLLHNWTFIYHNVSWIITLGWTNIFMLSIILVDKFFSKYNEKVKFWLYMLFVTIITTPLEVILLNVGIRGYDEILTSTMSGLMIPLTSAPIEILLTVPIVVALVIPFYKVFLRLCNVE